MEDYEEKTESVESEGSEMDEKAPIITKIIDLDDYSIKYDKSDVEKNMKYAVMSYIGFLFVVPILNGAYKKSKYLLFHVNQGFNLFIIELFVFVILGFFNSIFVSIIGNTPLWLSAINFVLYILIVSLMLYGIVNTINGKSKKIPILCKYKFIK